jgi:hypothetical protein
METVVLAARAWSTAQPYERRPLRRLLTASVASWAALTV